MKFLSLCSGIEAASVALSPLGWEAVAFAEIEPFPCAVLAHHYPDTPNLGDITRYHEWPTLQFRALIGGPPCQGFSLAGLRKGMADPRSRLSLTYVEIAAKYRSPWLVWENVPGILSINGGQDFADLLAAFTGRRVRVPRGGWQNSGCIKGIAEAYGIAWRVLDAQHCGVPQRRRRVFIVGYLGDWRLTAAVLFERESLLGNPPPCRSPGQGVAGTLTKSALDGSSPCGGDGREGLLIAHTLRGEGFDASEDGTGRGVPLISGTMPTLDANYGRLQGCSGQDLKHGHGHLIASTVVAKWAKGSGGPSGDECQNLVTCQDISPPLTTNPYVRRLTPRECERLQGFPDDYTLIPGDYRIRKPQDRAETVAYFIDTGLSPEESEALADHPDGCRYRALGNSKAVPVVRWIGARIDAVEALTLKNVA